MSSKLSTVDESPEAVIDEESRLTAGSAEATNSSPGILSWLQREVLFRKKACRAVAATAFAVVCIILYRPAGEVDDTVWPDPWMQELPRCQSTLYKPFRVGCPATCERAIGNETMYRMHAAWYFGQAKLFPESELPIAYENGIDYQAPREYIENFVQATKEVGDAASRVMPNITVALQEDIHMSLAYLCCLRKDETYWIREIMSDWVSQNHPFHFHVKFNKLECWHERFNSATNIMVGDDATQQVVMKFVHELYQAIEDHGIPMEVPREEQMPIHATLVGLQYGEGEQYGPEYDIRPYLGAIHDIVAPISKAFGDSWTGGSSKGMRVSHNPRISEGEWHAGAKP